MTFNQISMTKLKSRYKHEQFRTFCVLRADAGLYFERLSLKNLLIIFKLRINEHVMITNVHDFSKTFMIYIFSMTFPGFPWPYEPWMASKELATIAHILPTCISLACRCTTCSSTRSCIFQRQPGAGEKNKSRTSITELHPHRCKATRGQPDCNRSGHVVFYTGRHAGCSPCCNHREGMYLPWFITIPLMTSQWFDEEKV